MRNTHAHHVKEIADELNLPIPDGQSLNQFERERAEIFSMAADSRMHEIDFRNSPIGKRAEIAICVGYISLFALAPGAAFLVLLGVDHKVATGIGGFFAVLGMVALLYGKTRTSFSTY